MRKWLLGMALAAGAASGAALSVQQAPGVPRFDLRPGAKPAGREEIPLYPAGSLPKGAVPESWGTMVADIPGGGHTEQLIARNVSVPTITPFLPDPARATGAAVIVAPGGAFMSLSVQWEGDTTARWLADHGIAAFVLKYRLNPTPAQDGAFMAEMGRRMGEAAQAGGAVAGIAEPRATQDALTALKFVRAGAAKWKIDPTRVGMIGFSAGAMTTMQAVLTGSPAERPAFFGYVYGPMLPVAVPTGAPPMFAALALDDPLFGRQSFGVVDAWHKAGVPVELHAYERGSHGFGAGVPGTTTTLILPEFHLWMASNGFLGNQR